MLQQVAPWVSPMASHCPALQTTSMVQPGGGQGAWRVMDVDLMIQGFRGQMVETCSSELFLEPASWCRSSPEPSVLIWQLASIAWQEC